MSISRHILAVTKAGGTEVAIDFEGATLSWAALGAAAADIGALLDQVGIADDAAIGLIGRNGIEQVASFIALLAAGRNVVLINAIRPPALIVRELEELKLACVMASRADLSPVVLEAARALGTVALAASLRGPSLRFEPCTPLGAGPFRKTEPGVLIEIQTSGTTGDPKRIPVQERTVEASLRDGARTAGRDGEPAVLRPKKSPTLMFMPLVHTSGTFNTLMSLFECRPIVLFEKFDAEKYRQALQRYRPKFAPLPPTAIKMMVDSDATREDFASVIAVRAGTAPLSVDLQEAFEGKFGVPVLTTYGATEFLGVVTRWTLDDYRAFGRAKRGSVGRAAKGVDIRIVDPETRDIVPPGATGLLEAKLDRLDGGRNWIGTTDLAKVDEDGFLFILGRADDAIIRGGFKVMAGKVADILCGFPGVRDAFVLGRPDERLGEIPVAVIECYPHVPPIGEGALRRYARERLTPYEVPARFYFVEGLPRTVSDKISRPDLTRLLDDLEREDARCARSTLPG